MISPITVIAETLRTIKSRLRPRVGFFVGSVFVGQGALMPTALALCVRTESATLRSGPGTRFEVSWVVPKYYPLLEIERQNPWVKVRDQDGEIHWVHRNLVSQNISCLAITKPRTVARTKPSSQAPPAAGPTLEKYTPFRRIGESGSWYQVEGERGESLWVPRSAVWRPIRTIQIDSL